MTKFTGTDNIDTADATDLFGILIGFNPFNIIDLQDGIGDTFLCLGGDDSVKAGDGEDVIRGGAGLDQVFAGDGDDDVDGGDDNDFVNAGAGDDEVKGGSGDDNLFGLSGNDGMDGGDGVDLLNGGTGNDILEGGADGDSLFGDLGNDVLSGGADDDHLDGERGNDRLLGGAGNDRMLGSEGDDVLIGGTGLDDLRGGTGRDLFVFRKNDSAANGAFADDIKDFHSIADELVVSERDGIDLRGLEKQIGHKLKFQGSGPGLFDPGKFKIVFDENSKLVLIDTNGKPGVDFAIDLSVSTVTGLEKGDFLL